MKEIEVMTYDDCISFLGDDNHRKLCDDTHNGKFYTIALSKINGHIIVEVNNREVILLSKDGLDVFFATEDLEKAYFVSLVNIFLPINYNLLINDHRQVILIKDDKQFIINTRLSINGDNLDIS